MRRTEVLCVVGAALLVAPAAQADEPDLELSRDGRTWSSSLSGALLDEDARIVPGGSTRSDLWVRNSSGTTTTMSVMTRGTRSSLPAGVAPRDDFRVRVAGTQVPGAGTRECRVLTTQPLAPGEAQRVPVSMALPSTSRNISQDESVSLSLRVHLVAGEAGDACAGDAPDPGEGDPGHDDEGAGDGEDEAAPPTPGRVATDGGPGEGPALTDLLLLGLGALAAAATRLLRQRGRARRERPAS